MWTKLGKMELFSQAFRAAVLDALHGGRWLLGMVMLAWHPWADALKRDSRAAAVELTRENRLQVEETVRAWLKGVATECTRRNG